MPRIIEASSVKRPNTRIFEFESGIEKNTIILYLNELHLERKMKIGDMWLNILHMSMPLQKVIDKSLFEKISKLQPDLETNTFTFMDETSKVIFDIFIIGFIQSEELAGGNESKNTRPKLLNGARGGKYYLCNGKKIYV
jgi:hypothetical protein